MLFSGCLAPDRAEASREEETQLPSELPSTQSTGRLPAYWKRQDLQHHRGVGSLERMETGRGVKPLLCSIRQVQAKLRSWLQRRGALRNAEVVVHGELLERCWMAKQSGKGLPSTQSARGGAGVCARQPRRAMFNNFVL